MDASRTVLRGLEVETGLEDPTSGIVPVGNRRGHYVASFSARLAELEDCLYPGCVLS